MADTDNKPSRFEEYMAFVSSILDSEPMETEIRFTAEECGIDLGKSYEKQREAVSRWKSILFKRDGDNYREDRSEVAEVSPWMFASMAYGISCILLDALNGSESQETIRNLRYDLGEFESVIEEQADHIKALEEQIKELQTLLDEATTELAKGR